jgi:hypothetical protein
MLVEVNAADSTSGVDSDRPARPDGSRASFGYSIGVVLCSYAQSKGSDALDETSKVLQGALDMMILKAPHALSPPHGFGIARLDSEQ